MRLPLLIVLALLSAGWALYETRPARSSPLVPRPVPPLTAPLADAPPSPAHLARGASPAPRPRPAVAHVEAPPPPPRVATVSGRVVDEDGRPLTLAKVHIDRGSMRITLDLDENGTFTAVVPPGSYDVAVFDDEHDSVASGLDLEPEQSVSNLVFTLLPPEEKRRPTLDQVFSGE
jgi:Carboxypeptidase regulatory-like domain